MLVLTNEDVLQLVTQQECIEAIDEAFRFQSEGRATNAQSFRVFTPSVPAWPLDPGVGEAPASHVSYTYTVLVGAIEPLEVTAQRLLSHITYFYGEGDQLRQGKAPLSSGDSYFDMVMLFSTKTAEPLAFIHNGVLQKMRVAAATAVGARVLAREDASTMALLGSGWQASSQVEAHPLVRPLERIIVYSPNSERRDRFVEYWDDRLAVHVEAASSVEDAVRGADVVIAATNSVKPVVSQEWIKPGVFFCGVKDLEFEPDVYLKSDRFYATRPGPFWDRYIIGSHDMPPEEGEMASKEVPLLGDVLTGKVAGRTSPGEVLGLINKSDGVQFAAVGALVYRKAVEQGLGHEVPTELFLQSREHLFWQPR